MICDDALVFPAADGGEWSANAFEKWRRRVFTPALRSIGIERGRPYDLRHSFASLLLHEGRSVIYVARQLGHGAELTMRTYGHVIEELEDRPQLPAEDAISEARGALKPLRMYPFRTSRRLPRTGYSESPWKRRTPRPGFEPGAYSLGGSRSIQLSYRGRPGQFMALDCRSQPGSPQARIDHVR